MYKVTIYNQDKSIVTIGLNYCVYEYDCLEDAIHHANEIMSLSSKNHMRWSVEIAEVI